MFQSILWQIRVTLTYTHRVLKAKLIAVVVVVVTSLAVEAVATLLLKKDLWREVFIFEIEHRVYFI